MAEKVKVKIIGINCAMRTRNTAWCIIYALKAAEEFGRRISQVADVQTEFIDMAPFDRLLKADIELWKFADKPYNPADTPKDDFFAKEVLPKLRDADGFIIGSAVHSHSFTSRFIKFVERMTEAAKLGYLEGKPCATVSMATMRKGGQDMTLSDMNNAMKDLGLVLVNWGMGVAGTSGPPFGPFAMDDDHKPVASQKDEFVQKNALLTGRRIAEYAVMQKIAKQKLALPSLAKEFVELY